MQVFTEMQQGLATGVRGVENVELKGSGHPDTICDLRERRRQPSHWVDPWNFGHDGVGRTASRRTLELADMRDWVLPGHSFERHRSTRLNEPVRSVSAAGLSIVTGFRRSAAHCQEHLTKAECHLVSQIGPPIDRPHLIHVRVRGAEREVSPAVEHGIEAVVEREVAAIPCLWKSFLTQSIPVVG